MDQNHTGPIVSERRLSIVEMIALEKLWPEEKMSPALSKEGRRAKYSVRNPL